MSNEITAYFKGTTGVAESVYQHDYGMIMNIDGLTLSETFDVHFEISGSASTITAIGSNNRVAVPNDCLAVPGKLTAYIYTHTGAHDGETAYVVTFQVIGRARPDDDISDVTEEDNAKAIVQLQTEHEEDVSKINNNLDAIENNIDDVEAAATALTARVTTAESDIDSLETQFTTVVSAVTTDTEVTNIRVGDDGVTYSTAGEAVRNQFSHVKADIETINNIAIIQPTYSGKYIALNGGVGTVVNTDSPTTYAGYNSYVISCDEGDIFSVDITGGTSPRAYAWLDVNKKILYAFGANAPFVGELTAIENAKYLVINNNANSNSDGYVYIGQTTNKKLMLLNEKISEKVYSNGKDVVVSVANAFDRTQATTGKYLGGDGVTEVTNASYFHSGYIVISRAVITGFTGGSTTNMMALYDASKNVIEVDTIGNYINAVLPNNAVYCRFNGGMSAIDSIALAIRVTTNQIYKGQIEGLADPIIVKVGTGETYTTLKAAVEYAKTKATETQAVEIHLSEGTYDALDGFDLSAQTATFTGLELPNNVSIIGDGDKNTIVISAELPVDISAYSFDRNNVSTLNFCKNNSLKNVTVKAKNIRYAVHNDDYKTYAIEDAVETFEDCAFIYEALSDGVVYSTVSKVPFGTGMAKGRKMSFKRCLFQTDEPESKFASLFHNNTEQTKPCIVEFESCKFVGGWGGSVKASSAGSGVTDVMEFKGCKGDKIRFCKESVYTGTASEFKLYGYGNSFTGYTYEGITENANDTEMML